jgi:hypothetical protein
MVKSPLTVLAGSIKESKIFTRLNINASFTNDCLLQSSKFFGSFIVCLAAFEEVAELV